MNENILQIVTIAATTLISLYGMLRGVRNEIRSNQKQLLESKIAEERKTLAMENRLNLLEEKTTHYDNLITLQLRQISERLDSLFNYFIEHLAKARYEKD
jgi:hypothetical protein